MSNRGKGQVQKSAEQRLSKIEEELGEGVGKTITIIMHDFNPPHNGPPIPDRFTEDGTRIRVVLHPYPEDEEKEDDR